MKKLVFLIFLLFFASPLYAQPEMRSGSKGSSSAKPVTASSVDANINALDAAIYCSDGAGGLEICNQPSAGTGTSLADDADFVAGTTSGTPAMGFYQSVVTNCTDGDACSMGITTERWVKISIEQDNAGIGGGVQYTEGDAADSTITMTMAGMEISGNLFAPLQGSVADGQLVNLGTNNDVVVTNAGTFVVQEDGAALTALQLIDDAVATLGTTTYTEATTKGITIGCVRNDTLATLGNTDNEIVPIQCDADGAIYFNLARGGGQVEDAVVGSGDSGMPPLFNHDPTPAAATPSAAGDYSMAAVDGFQAQYVTLTDAAGAAVDASSIGGGTQHNEDDPSADLDTGTLMLARRTATPADTSGADLDYESLQLDNGRLWVSAVVTSAPTTTVTATNLDVQIGGSDTLTVAAHAVTNAGTFVVQEDGAALTALQLIDDAVVSQGTALGSTKVMMAGGSVTTSSPTYTTGQIEPLSLDTAGALRVTGGGGGTEYVTNAAVPTDPTGTTIVMEIDTVLSTLSTEVAGEWTNSRSTIEGALWVQDFNSDAILSDTTAILADTAAIQTAVELIDNAISGAGFNITQQGGVAVTLNTGAVDTGTQRITLATDDVLNVVCDSGCAGGVQHNEDDPSADLDTGTLLLARRTATPADTSGADLDYESLQMDNGRLWTSTTVTGTVTVAAHDVTNAGTFAIQVSDTSFAVADGNALGEGILIQGDDGTDRKNINVDATTGDVQVDVTNTVTVSATNLDVQIGGSDTLTVAAHDVTNAGTFATQATLQASTANVGDVDLELAGTAVTADVGTGDTGTIRVAVARDSDVCNPIDTVSVAVAETTSGSNEVIALTAGQTIYICDVVMVGTPATAFKLVSGAGTDCATTPVNKTGAMDFAATGGFAHNFGGRLKSDEADAICTDAGGTLEINGVITYVKVATIT